MKKRNRIIATLFLCINIIVLIVAVIPHHHHYNGVICMKQDYAIEHACPHHHHHPANHVCCDNECLTRFHSPVPSIHLDNEPDYTLITTLFTDLIIEQILRPLERRVKNYYVYRDSLHGTDCVRTIPLRAPPMPFFA